MEESELFFQTYRTYLDQFYKMRDSYNELVEQDRKINMEEKEKLIAELIALVPVETSNTSTVFWQEAAEKVKNLHELWKTIGPVARAKSEEIWKRFKDATDNFYSQRRAFFEELDKSRAENSERKRALLDKLKPYTEFESENIEDWRKAFEEIRRIQEEWRTVGSAPLALNKELIQTLNDYVNKFLEKRSLHFKELDQEKVELVSKKEELLNRAEALRDSEDWVSTAEALKQIQREWAETGADNFKESRKLRKRFRKACDLFFKRQKQHFQQLRDSEETNLKRKVEICDTIESYLPDADTNNRVDEVRKLKESFDSVGHVPMKAKEKIQTRFHKLYTQYIQKAVTDPDEREMLTLENRFSGGGGGWQGGGGGGGGRGGANPEQAQRDERKYVKKIRELGDKISQYETNVGFISAGKAGDSFRKEIEAQIQASRDLKKKLEQQLKQMRQPKGGQTPKAEKAAPSQVETAGEQESV